jgi:hypothetical protein
VVIPIPLMLNTVINVEENYNFIWIMQKVDLHIKVRKHCDSCDKYNHPEAKYCNYCGELITDLKIYFICWFENTKSPDLLQPKNKGSKSPDKRQNLGMQILIYHIGYVFL